MGRYANLDKGRVIHRFDLFYENTRNARNQWVMNGACE